MRVGYERDARGMSVTRGFVGSREISWDLTRRVGASLYVVNNAQKGLTGTRPGLPSGQGTCGGVEFAVERRFWWVQVAIDAGTRHWASATTAKKNMHLGGCAWDPREIALGDVRGMSLESRGMYAGSALDRA